MKPATPLPWSLDQIRPEPTHLYATVKGADRSIPIRIDGPDATTDGVYLVHACNNYPKLVEALRDSSMWLRIAQPSLPNTAVEDQNKATGEWLKTRGLADVVKAVEASNTALLRELGE